MEQTLRSLQLTQLEILKVIDGVCQTHDIPYSLYAGTLLGAVRHGGFIPWDDDLDICMAREAYDRFIQVWQQNPPEGYILQNKDTAPAFSQSFTKIRKDHTTFLQDERERGRYHTGIFVDVFPIDRFPASRAARLLFQWRCMNYQLLTREFVPPQASLPVRLGSALLLRAIPPKLRPQLRQRLLHQITKHDHNRTLPAAAIETMASLRIQFPADMLDRYTPVRFEDAEFSCFAGWHEHLTCKFGDYMQLPPEEDRTWKHHPIIIDFERNLDEISN